MNFFSFKATSDDDLYKNLPPLFQAAIDGDYRKLETLTSRGEDLSQKIPSCILAKIPFNTRTFLEGSSLLHIAAGEGKIESVSYLLELKQNVNTINLHKYTPMHLAALMGHINVISLLALNNADVNAKCSLNETSLHCTLQSRITNKYETVKCLLDKKADPNIQNWSQRTPLFYVDDPQILTMLVNRGANLLIVDQEKYTPVYYYIVQKNSLPLLNAALNVVGVNALIDLKTSSTSLLVAAGLGNIDFCKHLIQLGANILVQNRYGQSLFHLLAKNGNVEGLKEMNKFIRSASNGASSYIKSMQLLDQQGNTPLHLAVYAGKMQMVEFFLKDIALPFDTNQKDNQGQTALDIAVKLKNKEMIKLFAK